jgi:hypothetical protein
MDNPAVYGPQAYRLTFAEAARRDIICGYKVIISVITSEMVTNDLLSHGEVLVNGDAVRVRQVANQIALCDAIEKFGGKKCSRFITSLRPLIPEHQLVTAIAWVVLGLGFCNQCCQRGLLKCVHAQNL